ncbi:MAG TPA: hypothetical protein VMA36_00410 [Candidatus Limnocylindria bacterium]|nr:hypothetical protein [Candidatus Limnocylindria bacterium]
MTTPQPVENVFARAWDLLTHNWIIIVPGLVIGLIVGAISWFVAPHGAYDPNDPASLGRALARASSGLVLAVVAVVAAIANQAYTVGMAGAAWERGTATLADGAASFREDAGRIIMTMIGLIVLAVVAALLSIPTLGLALLAFYVFTLYAMPAAIVGNRPGFSSIAESFAIARARLVPTLILSILIFVISLVALIVTTPLAFIPLLGPIVQACLVQAVVAYVVLVVVGEYLNLRAAAAIPPASPSTPTV